MQKTIAIFLKGVAMGACDIVPGVSGGTIAFITGIYQELVDALSQIHPRLVGLLQSKAGLKRLWLQVNGSFLIPLGLGIATGVLLFSRLILAGLERFPIPLWSCFIGLIIASAAQILLSIPRWSVASVAALLMWTVFGYQISSSATAVMLENVAPSLLFFSGFIAVCAMILPGISGSFILVLLGSYGYILQSLRDFDLWGITIFICGCVLGLITISRLLAFLVGRFRDVTLASLSGLMLGSLTRIWPWKIDFANVMPSTYLEHTGDSPELLQAILAAALSMALLSGGQCYARLTSCD